MRASVVVGLVLSAASTCLAKSPTLAREETMFPAVRKASNTTTNGTCATGVHMIIARASTEQQGVGIIGAVATQVEQSVPGSDSEAVVYPATLTDYQNSESSGVAAMKILIQDYTTRCPRSNIALLGYSQGAQVVGDVLCGTSETYFNTTSAIPTAQSKNIVAVIQMGDPAHIPNLSQDVGNSTKRGIFNRTDTASCLLTDVTQSYCDSNDTFCDSGSSIPVHVGYVKEYGNQAANYIIGRLNGSIAAATTNVTGMSGNGSTTGPGAGASGIATTGTNGVASLRSNVWPLVGSIGALSLVVLCL